jgi:methylenetetrahydrofolate dehydrogenase (NADP+)/methenyltetrahydrofolate cyclohydrolase
VADILYGKDVAGAISEKLKREAAALAAKGNKPTLAILRIGERGDDIAYERGALKRCAEIGISVRQFILGADAPEDEILKAIALINGDASIHGCLMFRPLPEGIDEDRICNALLPEKDVDGITDISLAGVFCATGRGYPPCTAQACIELLEHYGIELAGKRAVVVGRSLVIGKPVAMMALGKNATVTLCHSKTKDLAAECRAADVLIVAAGRAGLVDRDCLNPEGTVIDVGINVDENGNLCGDVSASDVSAAKSYSPVPGGVGAVTTTVLAKHVIEAAREAALRNEALLP